MHFKVLYRGSDRNNDLQNSKMLKLMKYIRKINHDILIKTRVKYVVKLITSAKEVMFSVAFVCLSVCKITEKVMNGF